MVAGIRACAQDVRAEKGNLSYEGAYPPVFFVRVANKGLMLDARQPSVNSW
jgi:hypothetical protein